MELNEKLQSLRRLRGYSQSELATLVGVSRSAIAGYENGYTQPSLDILCRICEVFNISVDSLVDYGRSTPQIKHMIDPEIDYKPNSVMYMNLEAQLNNIQKNIIEARSISFADELLNSAEIDIAIKVIRNTIDLLSDLYSKG